ncbi:hypothetical protein KHA80_04940 [Anaerobacillus sp. HL2]|nr:hypothetical protein KHA80_04940 [Anaerobacillus sp. HL2]
MKKVVVIRGLYIILKMEKMALREEMKKWAFYRTVQFIIDEAKTTYERTTTTCHPGSSKIISVYFTNNEYEGLFSFTVRAENYC